MEWRPTGKKKCPTKRKKNRFRNEGSSREKRGTPTRRSRVPTTVDVVSRVTSNPFRTRSIPVTKQSNVRSYLVRGSYVRGQRTLRSCRSYPRAMFSRRHFLYRKSLVSTKTTRAIRFRHRFRVRRTHRGAHEVVSALLSPIQFAIYNYTVETPLSGSIMTKGKPDTRKSGCEKFKKRRSNF